MVFSDETLTVFEHADPETYSQIAEQFTRWTDIDVHRRGVKTTSGGHGFSALGRRELLRILQERAVSLGTDVRFGTEAPPVAELGWADLIVGADGASSAVRTALAREFIPTLDRRHCRYIWLGTDLVFDAFKFFIAETEHGVIQAHAYPYDDRMSTFIVEMHERTWERLGLGDRSIDEGVAWSEELFADALDGHRLFANKSRWINFVTVRNRRWCVDNVVLLGDAAHTAHFSIGSGTKLAMEDAVSLAWAFRSFGDDVHAATASYEAERRPIVESTQRAAQASLEWFEGIGRYVDQGHLQFAFNLLTRSRRVTYDNLRMRDPSFVRSVHPDPRPPMFTPLRLRGLELRNRVVVSPMDMYSADDGTPGDFHLVHLGSRALGGAGLVMTEMICVSDSGRITPGCAGMYRPEHVAAWTRIVSFAHQHGGCPIGAQIGHSGRKGSTRLMWEGMDEPLLDGNWELIAPSAVPYSPRNQVPRPMTRADMDVVRDQFVRAASGALDAGFDLLELHMAHGYLLSSFLSPVANLRDDDYGGSLERRARFPLEVLDACRSVWPDGRPFERSDLGDRLDPGRVRRRSGGGVRPDAQGARLRHRRRVVRPGVPARAARVRPQLPDPVRRSDPQRGRCPDHRRRRDRELRRRQHDRARRAAPICARSRDLTSTTPRGHCTPPPSRNTTWVRGCRSIGPDPASRPPGAIVCARSSSGRSRRSR